MTDKKEMPANGSGVAKGTPDGVSGSPDTGEMGRVHDRSSGGESAGGAYPNPHSGKSPTKSNFSRGQGQKAYYGGDNPNATTKPRNSSEEEVQSTEDTDEPVRKAHPVRAAGRTIEVIEDSGVAAAVTGGGVPSDDRDRPTVPPHL